MSQQLLILEAFDGISDRPHLRSADRGHLRLPTCETDTEDVRRTFICIRRPFKLELTSCSP